VPGGHVSQAVKRRSQEREALEGEKMKTSKVIQAL